MGHPLLDALARTPFVGPPSTAAVRRVLRECGDPQDVPVSVHVTGTNGKGSTAVCVAALLGADGRRVGLLTSPHLSRVTERVVVDGRPVTDDEFRAAADVVASSASSAALTYHEALTAIGFVAVAGRGVSALVVEAGCGGLLDGTNVLRAPAVTVVTTVGRDHLPRLGPTTAHVALHKLAVCRRGVPLVLGRLNGPLLRVARSWCAEHGVPVRRLGHDFTAVPAASGTAALFGDGSCRTAVPLPLAGPHQIDNVAVAVAAARVAGVSVSAMGALRHVRWPGRCEEFRGPWGTAVVDGAHNVDAVRALAAYVTARGGPPPLLVFSPPPLREWRAMIDVIRDKAAAWVVCPVPGAAGDVTADAARHLTCSGVRVTVVGSVDEVPDALRRLGPAWTLCFGSLYTAGRLRECFGAGDHPLWVPGSGEVGA